MKIKKKSSKIKLEMWREDTEGGRIKIQHKNLIDIHPTF